MRLPLTRTGATGCARGESGAVAMTSSHGKSRPSEATCARKSATVLSDGSRVSLNGSFDMSVEAQYARGFLTTKGAKYTARQSGKHPARGRGYVFSTDSRCARVTWFRNCRGTRRVATLCPKGATSSSPGLARLAGLPWVSVLTDLQPQRGCGLHHTSRHGKRRHVGLNVLRPDYPNRPPDGSLGTHNPVGVVDCRHAYPA